MEILVTSKTRKGNVACVGGLVVSNKRFVRLLNPGNRDQFTDTDFNIGEIWDLSFTNREDVEPPHIEDVVIHLKRYIRKLDNFTSFIENSGIKIYRGSPHSIFDGILTWTDKGSGYIGSTSDFPENSVGFWVSDKDLIHKEKYYSYPGQNKFSIEKRLPYVGFETATDVIPAGTLTRISLARWWKPEDSDIEERCYLQLSGWYQLPRNVKKQ